MTLHGRRRPLSRPRIGLCEGCLRHQRAESGVVGLLVQLEQLLFGDGQLLTEARQLAPHALQSSLDEHRCHLGSVRGHRRHQDLGRPRETDEVSCQRIISAVPAIAGVAVLLLCGGLLSGCGGDGRADPARCGPIVVEQIDPNEAHLIGGAAEPDYLTDPPTSGPHIAGLVTKGRVDRPLTDIEQVSTLETGAVIIQYDDSAVGGDAREQLRAMAADDVVVAPGRKLPTPVVATGWLRKMSCTEVDADALDTFVTTVQGQYDGHSTTTTG